MNQTSKEEKCIYECQTACLKEYCGCPCHQPLEQKEVKFTETNTIPDPVVTYNETTKVLQVNLSSIMQNKPDFCGIGCKDSNCPDTGVMNLPKSVKVPVSCLCPAPEKTRWEDCEGLEAICNVCKSGVKSFIKETREAAKQETLERCIEIVEGMLKEFPLTHDFKGQCDFSYNVGLNVGLQDLKSKLSSELEKI